MMEKKTFDKLQIGDIVYKVWTNYESREKPKWEKITINQISLEGLELQINKHRGYSDYSYLLRVLLPESNVTIIETKECFLTTDYNEVCRLMKIVGLRNIKDLEDEIQRKKNAIEAVRKSFYEYLNYTITEPIPCLPA